MSSKAKLLARPGPHIKLKNGDDMHLICWNRQTEMVHCWKAEAGNDKLLFIPTSEFFMSRDGTHLFQTGTEGEEEGEEQITRVFFKDGRIGELLWETAVGCTIFVGKDIIHRDSKDFVREVQDFREVREQTTDTPYLGLLSYGNCGILMNTGKVGKITEWDLLTEQVTVFMPDQVCRVPFAKLIDQEGFSGTGKRYRLVEGA